jgi:GNAT superfamily N-acetyltransferase
MIRNRTMRAEELPLVLDWAAEEGWNPGLDDAAPFHAADPDGFFVAEASGQVVAAISVVNHGPDFAFLGLYLCRPSHRGRGIGHGLWRHAIAHAGNRTVGLDGVPAQQANYARAGFVRAGETTRWSGPVPPARHEAVRPLAPADIPDLVALEAEASGVAKPAYLAVWFAEAETRRTFVLVRGDAIRGLVTIRRCRTGAKVGPLVAVDIDAALDLLRHASAEMGPEITIDLPQGMEALGRQCAAFRMAPGFRTARMYRGTAPTRGDLVHAVASLELG